ncbi:hypothetical protein SDC9_185999 [bioreactor metagenome]|uniref:Uncharacterized protein n=1 Tax=bioreactor metagenome TaxID=1076179 RepID=A0A645HHG1_9ZZZZ
MRRCWPNSAPCPPRRRSTNCPMPTRAKTTSCSSICKTTSARWHCIRRSCCACWPGSAGSCSATSSCSTRPTIRSSRPTRHWRTPTSSCASRMYAWCSRRRCPRSARWWLASPTRSTRRWPISAAPSTWCATSSTRSTSWPPKAWVLPMPCAHRSVTTPC